MKNIIKSIIIGCMLTFSICILSAQNFINPILPGAHPDPSICRVGDDYYIVNSTFEWFPGLPIHHSKDLVNWELIGYGLHKESQCPAIGMFDVQENGGIHAPTIRYNNGKFYIITTSVYKVDEFDYYSHMINFIITADKPEGPWSDPHVIEGAVGIDPDIFFDEDGKVWYVGTCTPGNNFGNGIGEIWTQELDLKNWKLIGERYSIWNGACGGVCAEGPHMYKIKGKYYLMIAEGGTSFNHSDVIAVSDNITGPFTSNPRNPIISVRQLSYDNWVHSTGHADMVEMTDGRWVMVCLGKRNDTKSGHSNMGRETHLVPVIWEQDRRDWIQPDKKIWWPVCAPKTGRVERYNPVPFPGTEQRYNASFHDNFDADQLNLEWNFRRYPQEGTYSLTAKESNLRLYLKPQTIDLRKRYSFMGFRQKESDFEYKASMKFAPKKNGAEAGISLMQLDDNYINMTVRKEDNKINLVLSVFERKGGLKTYKSEELKGYEGKIIFKIYAKGDTYSYYYSLNDGKDWTLWTTTSSELIICYSYTGAFLGIYATSNGLPSKEYADFDWVSYKGFVRH